MSVKIRLARWGTKKRPYYRVVVADSRSPRDGKYIEQVGSFNPLLPDGSAQKLVLDLDRIKYWIGTGAQVSDRIHRFLHKEGVIKSEPLKKTNNVGLSKDDRKKLKEEQAEAAKQAADAKKAAAAAAAAAPAA